MSERICYLHVGTGKTGSSAIQYALTKAHHALLDRGYLYPDASNDFSRVLAGKPTAGNASCINRCLRDEGAEPAVEVAKQYSTNPLHLVLSCEGFSNRSAADLEGLGAGLRSLGYQTRCLIFFRPQYEKVVSSYLQQVKARKVAYDLELRDYVISQFQGDGEGRRWNWYARARKLEEAFGEGNVTVKWYPAVRRLGPEGVVRTVLEWLGTPSLNEDSHFSADKRLVNPTPGREALIILRKVNSRGIGGKRFADEFLSGAQRAGWLGSKIELDRSTAAMIHARTRESNVALLKRYCPLLSADVELELPLTSEAECLIDDRILRNLATLASDILAKDGSRATNSLPDIFGSNDKVHGT